MTEDMQITAAIHDAEESARYVLEVEDVSGFNATLCARQVIRSATMDLKRLAAHKACSDLGPKGCDVKNQLMEAYGIQTAAQPDASADLPSESPVAQ